MLLAHAGVDHQSDGQRQIGFLGEIANALGSPVFRQHEIVFGEIADDLIFLGAHGSQTLTTFTSVEKVG